MKFLVRGDDGMSFLEAELSRSEMGRQEIVSTGKKLTARDLFHFGTDLV